MKVFCTMAMLGCLLAGTAQAAPVNINTADVKTIDKELKGVSPKTAQAIVDYRGKNGPFKSVEELTKVKGVGKATIDKNRANLTIK